MPFPRAVDYHKPGRPEVPNGLGVFYVLASSAYLFALYASHAFWGLPGEEVASGALPLACCLLFGGFLGLLDDWMDLRWRYKALTPLVASLPLVALRQGHPIMATYIFGKINFGIFYYLLIVPAIMTVTTNVVNQLGGLNGLETLCPLTVMAGLLAATLLGPAKAVNKSAALLLIVPILALAVLAIFNFTGRVFVGNVGSFSFGITLAAYAIIANVEQALLIAILPYVAHASLVLLNYFIWRRLPALKLTPEGLLYAEHRRSLQTLLAYKRPVSERRLVLEITGLFALSSALAVLATLLS